MENKGILETAETQDIARPEIIMVDQVINNISRVTNSNISKVTSNISRVISNNTNRVISNISRVTSNNTSKVTNNILREETNILKGIKEVTKINITHRQITLVSTETGVFVLYCILIYAYKLNMMNLSLENKNAVICGSTQGIGLATAIILAGLGANCILIARNESALKIALKQLPIDTGQNHTYRVADFSNPETVKAAIEKITEKVKVEILVNNSGGPKPGPITDASADDFLAAFNQHLICNQILTTAVLPGMKSLKYGRIINIVSTSVKTPLINLGVSNTIRAAVAGWAKTLSNEVGQYQITVNNVLPGLTNTVRYKSLVEGTSAKENISKEAVEHNFISSIPLRRIGEAEEIGNMIAFLASPAAAYVTGTSIPVDGGRTPSI